MARKHPVIKTVFGFGLMVGVGGAHAQLLDGLVNAAVDGVVSAVKKMKLRQTVKWQQRINLLRRNRFRVARISAKAVVTFQKFVPLIRGIDPGILCLIHCL